jgi:hypothetical protein
VPNLSKQQFEVEEDSKTQTIDFFEEHTAGSVPVARLPPLPPNTYSNQPAVAQSDSVNALLLDSLNTPEADQARIHKQILEFLAHKNPNTQIAIFALNTRLSLLQGFTADSSLLSAAVNRNPLQPAPLLHREAGAMISTTTSMLQWREALRRKRRKRGLSSSLPATRTLGACPSHWTRCGNWFVRSVLFRVARTLSGLRVHFLFQCSPTDGDVSLATGVYDLNAQKAGTLEIPWAFSQHYWKPGLPKVNRQRI